ncbi:hypothetical protein VKT23_006034 [Stygiomarasmius scandens]|uniref:Uncharacterized protein n=1 Tax=Marasmiellus scandens TaxID=2682957 RepID=A0ABR1JPQ1_9AGAR
MSDLCPVYAPFFSAMGCTSAIVFTCEHTFSMSSAERNGGVPSGKNGAIDGSFAVG